MNPYIPSIKDKDERRTNPSSKFPRRVRVVWDDADQKYVVVPEAINPPGLESVVYERGEAEGE